MSLVHMCHSVLNYIFISMTIELVDPIGRHGLDTSMCTCIFCSTSDKGVYLIQTMRFAMVASDQPDVFNCFLHK